MTISEEQISELLQAAGEAADRAYAPYSNFQVGAALLTPDGRIFLGCNVENASYGLTVCAERNAIFSAVSQGMREFTALAIIAQPADHPAPPCGACRQVLHEFNPDLPIISATLSGERKIYKLSQLLPEAF